MDRKAAEQFLGVDLPDAARNVQFRYFKPGDDQSLYWAYLKFECGFNDYLRFAAGLGLKTAAEQMSPHLPAAWGLPQPFVLSWWDAGSETPANAAARSIAKEGRAVAKYEHGSVYLMVTGSI